MPNASPVDLRVISLFSGIGGLDLGFARYGVTPAACLEIDRACCETINENRHLLGHHEHGIVPLDITAVSPEKFYSGKVDLIIGGPPCQSFSAAGRRAGGVTGTDDARGSLFWYYCKYVEHFQPKAFLFENVRGILSSKGGRDWEIIRDSFRKAGYDLHWKVLNAADYGTPQNRERLFMVGFRSDLALEFRFPRPTHGPDSIDGKAHVTAGVALADIDDPSEFVPPYGGKYGDLLPAIPPGENYSFYTEEMGHPHPLFAWRSKFSGFLYKLSPDGLSKTIVAQQGRYDGPFHWRNRKCNIAELKRLQGFPDNFKIPHGHGQAAKQVGNSVSPPVADALANVLLQQLGHDVRDPIALLDEGTILTFDKRKRDRAALLRAKRTVVRASFSQPELFSGNTSAALVTVRERGERAVLGRTFSEVLNIVDGVGTTFIGKSDSEPKKMSFQLTFSGMVSDKLRQITCLTDELTMQTYHACWQSMHELIGRFTSFPSLSPLYGHFTEPHPKFSLQVTVDGDDHIAKFIRLISTPGFTEASHDMSLLSTLGIENSVQFLKIARSFGIDARTNHTNRTIPLGRFRICYPFALPSTERQFVVWTDAQVKKRHDFNMSELAE